MAFLFLESLGSGIDGIAQCLANGNGSWHPVSSWPRPGQYPYLFPTVLGTNSRYWYGECDDDLVAGNRTSIRSELMYRWKPQGNGCHELNQKTRAFSDVVDVGKAFCSKHSGKHIMIVGDSTQRQMWQTLVVVLGMRKVADDSPEYVQTPLNCSRTVNTTGSRISSSVMVCPHRKQGIRATYIANEFLSRTAHAYSSKSLCNWLDLVPSADFILLNRGLHFMPTNQFIPQLTESLQSLMSMVNGTSTRVLYRNTWQSFFGCGALQDPLTHPYKLGSIANKFHWNWFTSQNDVARDISKRLGVPYMNVAYSSSFRPGGHHKTPGCFTTAQSSCPCSHWCIPGPIDHFLELVLASWL